MKKLLFILLSLILITGCTFNVNEPHPFTNVFLVDENDIPFGVDREGNRPVVESPTWEFSIAAGNITAHDAVTVFGHNNQVDNNVTADVWHGGATGGVSLIWVAPTTDRIHDIASTDAADNATQGGARTVEIFGLDDWDTLEISEIVTMNGTNNVATVNDYVIINHMEVLTSGATSVNVGTITATAQTDNTVTAQIIPGEGASQATIRGFPSIQTVYIGRFYGNINRSGGAAGAVDFTLFANIDPENNLTSFNVIHTFGVITTGTSALTINYYVPKVVDGPAIIKIQVASSANSMDVAAGYDLIRGPQ